MYPLPATDLPKVPPNMVALDPNRSSLSDLVTHFSTIYQHYDQTIQQLKAMNNTGVDLQWAEYYADLSTRAAHHYNDLLLKQRQQPQVQQVPQVHQQQQQQQAFSAPPKSFQQFAHRNLMRCTDNTQKSAMTELIQLTIQKAIQNGTMHSKNWDYEPLLPLPNTAFSTNTPASNISSSSTFQKGKSYLDAINANSSPNKNNKKRKGDDRDYSYYTSGGQGTTTSTTKNTTANNNNTKKSRNTLSSYDDKLPENDSYYGSNSGTSTTTKTTKHNTSSINNDKYDTTNSFQFGDYISLSPLSNDKYLMRNNKLIKTSSSNLSKGTTSTSSNTSTSTNSKILGKMPKTNKSKLASRLHRFSGQGGIADATSSDLHSVYKQGVEKYMGKTVISSGTLDESDYEKMTVKGTCQVLEKEYLRLTAPPRAELVRPQPILKKHLNNLKTLYKNQQKSNQEQQEQQDSGKVTKSKKKKLKKQIHPPTKQKDYNWFCSQLKAIRQDLTVQRIFNDFAVDVYETHARIALEQGDLNEYNQSQTQLKELYELITHQQEKEGDLIKQGLKNQNEFIAYRIIYYVFLTGNKKYDGGSSDLFKIMLSLSPEQRNDPSIAHALKVRVAVADNDYHSFFRLQDKCPNLGAYLMDMMIGHIRAIGLQCMVKAYRPSLSVKFILQELGFSVNGDELDLEEGLSWLKHCGCKLSDDGDTVLTKDTALIESNLVGKKASSLI